MASKKFEYGPISRAIFNALLWVTLVVGFTDHNFLIYYIPFLVFLGLGLRPLIEKTGAYEFYHHILRSIEEWRYRKFTQRIGEEIDRQARDNKYRKKRRKDPKLPKNW